MEGVMPDHLIGICQIRKLYNQASGKIDVARSTVNAWLDRRGIKALGGSEKDRRFQRSAVVTALNKDFPPVPKFITAEDAFHMSGSPYPRKAIHE
jgi:hypothetical protein